MAKGFKIKTGDVHNYGFVCITDARFLSPEYRAKIAETEDLLHEERSDLESVQAESNRKSTGVAIQCLHHQA